MSRSDSSADIGASACDFQQCGILTCVDSDEPLLPPVKLSFVVSSVSLSLLPLVSWVRCGT